MTECAVNHNKPQQSHVQCVTEQTRDVCLGPFSSFLLFKKAGFEIINNSVDCLPLTVASSHCESMGAKVARTNWLQLAVVAANIRGPKKEVILFSTYFGGFN